MPRRHPWVKRSLLAVLVVLVLTAAAGYWAFTRVPAYYRRPPLSPEERANAANRAEKKLIRTREWANDLWVSEHRSLLAGDATAPSPGSRPSTAQTTTTASSESFSVSFTEDELNAFLGKWSGTWDQRYRDSLSNPAVILEDDRIILAGTVTDLHTVASFHFYPRLDAQGQLLLTLEAVRAGRLPMPEMVWAPQRQRVLAGLERRLPGWQREARIAPNGIANPEAVAADMSKLLFDVLAGRPREAVLFIPLDADGRAVPVRLTAIDVGKRELSLTVEPLSAEDRLALLERIRQPLTPAVVASVN